MDNLKKPIRMFYDGLHQFAHALTTTHAGLTDEGGRTLLLEACRRKHIKDAIGASYMRRTHTNEYLSTSEDGKYLHLHDFESLGPRWVNNADKVANLNHTGWYTDEHCNDSLRGVVLCFTRHGAGTRDNDYDEHPKARHIYMAGMVHSDWDGVTLDRDITDDVRTAARWADQMAEREAAVCREADEEYRREERRSELRDQIKDARAACLKLLREMRPLRKGLATFPEAVCEAMRQSVSGYVELIAEYRKQLRKLA